MNARQKNALAEIGVETKRYCLDGDYDGADWSDRRSGPIWGLGIIRDGREVAVVESTVPEVDRRFFLRNARRGIDIGAYKTQREALAGWLRREYL